MNSKKTNTLPDSVVLKWIYNACKKQMPIALFLIFVNVIHGVSAVFLARFSKSVIDSATVSKDMQSIIKFGVILIGIVLLQVFLTLIRNGVAERCKGRITIALRHRLLNVIMNKNYADISSYHTGDLQNRLFGDIDVIASGFTSIIPNTVFFITKLTSALIYLVVIDKTFALIFLVGGVVVFLSTQLFRKTLKSLHTRVQETEGKTRSFMQEALINLLAVKAFSTEDKILSQSDDLQEINFKAKMKRRDFGILANTGLSGVFSIGSVFAIVFGAWRILNGVMTYGDLIAMTQLVNQVQSPFASLSGIMPQYYSMLASAERLIEIDNLDDEIEVNDSDFDAIDTYDNLLSICFDNISFKYDRDIVLDNTSLKINKGDFVAVMGISGIGKSTLLKLLLGVFAVQDGDIYLDTKNGKIPVDKYTRKLFSYVPQGNLIISGTVRDNLTFINSNVTDEEIERAIDISCSRQFIDELPKGIDTVIGENGLGLSEGQAQRLAIARSIISNAPVLLLDESTSALDEETEKQLLTNLKKLDDVSCIIISHKRAALDICNKHIQIINGKIVEEKLC